MIIMPAKFRTLVIIMFLEGIFSLPLSFVLLYSIQIAFQVLVKALISLETGKEMDFLKEQFQEFMAGLMCLPINFPGTRLYRSLQVFH